MADPAALFRSSPGRHAALKVLWPELHDALAGETPEVKHNRELRRCVEVEHADVPLELRPVAVGRITLNHGFACADCIERKSARPGGYPLGIVNPRDYR
jgi:hypothetical protein